MGTGPSWWRSVAADGEVRHGGRVERRARVGRRPRGRAGRAYEVDGLRVGVAARVVELEAAGLDACGDAAARPPAVADDGLGVGDEQRAQVTADTERALAAIKARAAVLA